MPTTQPSSPVVDPLRPILDFIRDTLADGRVRVAEHIIDWTAWKVQHPLEAPGTTLAFVGRQGTGKTTYTRMVEDIFGSDRVVTASNERQMMGNFNAHFRGKVIAVFEEAFLGRDKSIAGPFKDLVTGHRLHIEGKSKDIVDDVNRLAVMLTSNSTSVVPLEPGDRRTTLVRVSDARRQDTAYFENLWTGWTNGGREAFIRFLLARDLSKFDQRKVLDTPEKAEATGENGDMPVQFWAELLDSGKVPTMLNPDGSEPDWNAGPLTVPDSVLYDAFKDFAKDRGAQLRYLETKAALMRRLEELCPAMRATQPRPTPNRPGVRSRAFPPLVECRAAFNTAIGGAG